MLNICQELKRGLLLMRFFLKSKGSKMMLFYLPWRVSSISKQVFYLPVFVYQLIYGYLYLIFSKFKVTGFVVDGYFTYVNTGSV